MGEDLVASLRGLVVDDDEVASRVHRHIDGYGTVAGGGRKDERVRDEQFAALRHAVTVESLGKNLEGVSPGGQLRLRWLVGPGDHEVAGGIGGGGDGGGEETRHRVRVDD